MSTESRCEPTEVYVVLGDHGIPLAVWDDRESAEQSAKMAGKARNKTFTICRYVVPTVEQACAVTAVAGRGGEPRKAEWLDSSDPRRPECADPNCGLSTDTAEAFRVIRDCEPHDYCHVECAVSHARELGRLEGIAEAGNAQAEWVTPADVIGKWPAMGTWARIEAADGRLLVCQVTPSGWLGQDAAGPFFIRPAAVRRFCAMPLPPLPAGETETDGT